MGVSGAGMVMLWVLLHEMHCMSCGSKDREIFSRMFLLLSVRDVSVKAADVGCCCVECGDCVYVVNG